MPFLRSPRLLSLLAALCPGMALAECGPDAAFDFMQEVTMMDWSLPERSEFNSTEGPGILDTYRTAEDARRHDQRFCVSFFCASSISVQTPWRDAAIYFFNWGGSAMPESRERSTVFLDRVAGESCVVNHQGGDEWRGMALGAVADIETDSADLRKN